MAKKQKHPNYEQNPPQQTRRQLPDPEARMMSTSLNMDDPRYDLGPESQLAAVNAVGGRRYQYAEGGEGRMIFPASTPSKSKSVMKGRP